MPNYAKWLYTSVALPRVLYAVDIWCTPTNSKHVGPKTVGSAKAVKQITSVQRAGALAVTGSLHISAMDALNASAFCYNPPYIFPGSHSPDPVTICLPDKLPVLKDQPPIIFPSAMPPNLMSKQLLPMNPPLVEDLPSCADMPCPMSTEPLPEPLVLEPPVEPLVPIPWNIHCH